MSRLVDPAPETPRNRCLVGRAAERAMIDALVRDAERGVSGALLIHGPAGIGKSALVQYALAGPFNFRVARTAGVESGMGSAVVGSRRRPPREAAGPLLAPGPPDERRHYERTGDDLRDGLYVELGPWRWHLFHVESMGALA